jgi:hypothetical protein
LTEDRRAASFCDPRDEGDWFDGSVDMDASVVASQRQTVVEEVY